MAKLSKAKRGKKRWIGLMIDQKPISRSILEEKIDETMQGIDWKLYDLVGSDLHTVAILKTSLGDSQEAKDRINSIEGISTLTTSGKIRLVRERLSINK
ncbi:MAG TPA: hypothetical protein HA315_03490 [Candidatus Thalassarchaeaceae archaeon]|jgi:hypothetical protein|nr:MAG TPA: hypothetical protein D7H72_03480 [Candidatus Poseidoniales archaeon]HII35044.1 hypothetical protein [Candidatus Thalassarchaeaceae archaeon]|tara:strand:+ start:13904 stop:14200 length:297 start_codon:yes stop_codon:yes gene_type:complete